MDEVVIEDYNHMTRHENMNWMKEHKYCQVEGPLLYIYPYFRFVNNLFCSIHTIEQHHLFLCILYTLMSEKKPLHSH